MSFYIIYQEKIIKIEKCGIIQNGTWAPSAGKCMKEVLNTMKNIEIIEPMVTIKSTLKEDSRKALEELADNIVRA